MNELPLNSTHMSDENSKPLAPHEAFWGDEETIVTDVGQVRSAAVVGTDRYQFIREVARGGIGVILQARDLHLRRDIACKILRPEHAGAEEVAWRFVEEAQIASQLQHPGIVPVYEMGRLLDQRPYFTMRLVKGCTLAALLRERKAPLEDLSRYLGVFEQICQAMAYAHARGVIHRDLKPSNVMVGRFGEVQVMDWGLAKVLGERALEPLTSQPAELTDASIIETPSTRDSHPGSGIGAETSAGSVLGTVPYMAPEQARGDTELVDRRSDVFGLGAVLCEILTGKPPYAGEDIKRLFHRAACGDLRDALERLETSGADRDLVALATRCLAIAPDDRPAEASKVADAIREHLDGIQERLRRAQLDQAAAEARAEQAKATAAAERREKRLTGWLAAAIVLLGLLGVASWRWRDQTNRAREAELAARRLELQQRDQRAAMILQESITLQGEDNWFAALASARRAGDLIDSEGNQALRARIARQITDLQLLDALERARIESLGVDVKKSRISHEGLRERFVSAFREAGFDFESLGHVKTVERLESSGIRDRLIAMLWFWSSVDPSSEGRGVLRALLKSIDRTSSARRVADSLDAGDDAALRKLVADTDCARVPADLAFSVGQLIAAKDRVLSRDWLLKAQRAHPSDFWINFLLGHHLLQEGSLSEAIGYFRVALAVHPRHAGVMLNLAVSHFRQQAFPQAELFYREAIRAEPDYAIAHIGLGDALRFQHRDFDAAEAYRTAIGLSAHQRDSGWEKASVGLGESLLAIGDPGAADLLQSIIDHNPQNVDAWVALAKLHYRAGSWAESERCYREVLAIDSRSAAAQSGLAASLINRSQFADAEAAFRVAREYLGADRGPAWEYATRGLADSLSAQGKQAEANQVREEFVSPGDGAGAAWLMELAKGYQKESKWADAERCFRQVLSLEPGHIQAHIDLASVLSSQNRPNEAADEFNVALELLGSDRGALWWSATLGYASFESLHGDSKKAITMLEELLTHNPRHPSALFRLGVTHRRQRNWPAAEDAFRKLVEAAPQTAPAHLDLAWTLLSQAKYAQAEKELRTGLELLGRDRTTYWRRAVIGLAAVEAAQGRPEKALDELTRRAAEALSQVERDLMLVHYHGFRREWKEVGRAYLASFTSSNDEHASVRIMLAAAAFLLGDDEAGYRAACAAMLQRYAETSNPVDADRTVKACCLSRRFDGDLSKVQELAEIAVRGQEQHSWYAYFTLARAMAALRTGDWDGALNWARKSRERAPTFVQTAGPNWLVEALAMKRLGQADAAQQALEAAIAMRDAHAADAEEPFHGDWGDWLIFDALRADIEALLAE